jgi:hypothetical protein
MSTSEYPAPPLGPTRLPRLRDALARAGTPVSAEVWVLVGLIALAAAIRILTINNQSLWMDESLTAYEARLPFGAMLHTVTSIETTPPLYFVLVWGWAKVFGTSAVALRAISTLAGIALVPIAYLAARELASRRAGVIAAALVTVNPFLIWFSQEARAYMLLAALTGAGFLWFLRARNEPSRRNLGLWAVCSALAVTTHFFAGFVVAPEALWLLWTARNRAAFVAVAMVGAVQLAMLPFAIADTGHGTGWIASVPRLHRLATMVAEWGASLLSRRVTFPVVFGAAGVLVVLVAVLVLCSGESRLRRAAGVAAVVGGFAVFAPLALGLFGQDYFLSRNVIPAFVPLVSVIAIACATPRAPVAGALLAAILLAMFSGAAIYVQTHASLERPDWRNVARALGPAPVPRAVLAADGTTADPLKIYMPHVNWVQPQQRRVLISEIDVVGATKHLLLRPDSPAGAPVPSTAAPRGARLISRFRVDNWVVGRFALVHPRRLDVRELISLAPRFFRRTPNSLLVFMQERGR